MQNLFFILVTVCVAVGVGVGVATRNSSPTPTPPPPQVYSFEVYSAPSSNDACSQTGGQIIDVYSTSPNIQEGVVLYTDPQLNDVIANTWIFIALDSTVAQTVNGIVQTPVACSPSPPLNEFLVSLGQSSSVACSASPSINWHRE